MKNLWNYMLMLLTVSLLASCSTTGGSEDKKNRDIAEKNGFYLVEAAAETTPVASSEDAADDLAIWYNPNNPAKSTIIATNKQKGLLVYNLEGEELFNYPLGELNNVDIRTKFGFNGDSITIVGATNRTENTINLFKVNTETGALEELPLEKTITPKSKDVYGFCFYKSQDPKHKNKIFAISVGTDGKMDQWELQNTKGKVKARFVRVVKFDSKCEGLVADDETGNLFVGEEVKGIWKMAALPAGGDKKTLVSDMTNSKLKADIEGLTIYYGKNKGGYLIASSQGNNSFAVFRRDGSNKYLGSFMIAQGGNVDGVSDTDGIDVLNLSLGSDYPKGVFIAQDGFNYEGETVVNQNFKLVNWNDIASQFKPWLLIDNTYEKP
jgi:3-phytase